MDQYFISQHRSISNIPTIHMKGYTFNKFRTQDYDFPTQLATHICVSLGMSS